MSDLKQLAALTALNEMFHKGHVCICTVRSVGEMLGVDPKRGGESYQILSTLHCVDFAKMPDELRTAVPRLVQDCLGVEPTFQFTTLEKAREVVRQIIEATPPEPTRGLVRRLLGGAP